MFEVNLWKGVANQMNRPMQTTFRKNIIITACLALVLSACGTNNDSEENGPGEEATVMPTTISGSVTYRERIALTPGYTLKVTLSDVSLADSIAPVLAETSRVLQNEQVPLAFEIEVEGDKLLPRHQYQVRAMLHDPAGELAWSTDTAYPIDTSLQNQDLGMLQLIGVDHSVPSQDDNALTGTSWQVEDVASGGIIDSSNLTLTFGEDGRINGSSGCNSYMGDYSVNGDELELSQLASTMMACPPAIMDLERKFLDVLGGAEEYSIDPDTMKLTITASNGQTIRTSLNHRPSAATPVAAWACIANHL